MTSITNGFAKNYGWFSLTSSRAQSPFLLFVNLHWGKMQLPGADSALGSRAVIESP